MKTIIYLIWVLSIVLMAPVPSYAVFATHGHSPTLQESRGQAIAIRNICIRKAGNGASICLGERISSVMKKFGTPKRAKREYFDMVEEWGNILEYEGCTLYFLKGVVDSYVISDKNFQVGAADGPFFRIGQDLGTLGHYLDITKRTPGYGGAILIEADIFFHKKRLNNHLVITLSTGPDRKFRITGIGIYNDDC